MAPDASPPAQVEGGPADAPPSGLENRAMRAILITDLAGCGALSDEREVELSKRLASDLETIRQCCHHFAGKVVANRGDGLKVVFDSPVNALRAAIMAQEQVHGKNVARSITQMSIRHRMGLHFGDVVLDEGSDDVSGRAVAIAARLEQKCEPGLVCYSDAVHQNAGHILRTARVGTRLIGNIDVKNLRIMVKAWMAGGHSWQAEKYLAHDEERQASSIRQVEARRKEERLARERARNFRIILCAFMLGLVGMAVAGLAWWQAVQQESLDALRSARPAAVVKNPIKLPPETLQSERPKVKKTGNRNQSTDVPVKERQQELGNPDPEPVGEDPGLVGDEPEAPPGPTESSAPAQAEQTEKAAPEQQKDPKEAGGVPAKPQTPEAGKTAEDGGQKAGETIPLAASAGG